MRKPAKWARREEIIRPRNETLTMVDGWLRCRPAITAINDGESLVYEWEYTHGRWPKLLYGDIVRRTKTK